MAKRKRKLPTWHKWLRKQGACDEGVAFAKGKSLAEAWRYGARWREWFIEKNPALQALIEKTMTPAELARAETCSACRNNVPGRYWHAATTRIAKLIPVPPKGYSGAAK